MAFKTPSPSALHLRAVPVRNFLQLYDADESVKVALKARMKDEGGRMK